MKLYIRIFVGTMVVIGGIFMANHYGSCSDSKYQGYSSEDSELNLTMDYLTGWRYSESRGSYGSYAQVQFIGEVQDSFAPSFIVTAQHVSKAKFQPLTIDGLADDVVKKRKLFEGSQLISKSEAELFGLPAVDLLVAYKQPEQIRSLEFNLIPFKERIIIVQKDDRFYTLRYVNPEQEFNKFEEAFLHCIKTLKFKE